jgi:hypothetical protein
MKPIIKFSIYCLLVWSITFTSCKKENQLQIPTRTNQPPIDTLSPQPPPAANGIFYNLSWTQCTPGDSNLWCLQWVGGDIFEKHSYNSNFGSAYYSGHVRVSVKQENAMLWTNVPFVPHDHWGQNNYDLYFTDDNYIVSFPFGTVNAPRIIIIAKTFAPFDFAKKVSVKIVFI